MSRNGNLNLNRFRSQQGSVKSASKVMTNGMTGIGLVVLLVVLALTVASVIAAINISPWFFIATVILGGYSLVVAIWIFVVRTFAKEVDSF